MYFCECEYLSDTFAFSGYITWLYSAAANISSDLNNKKTKIYLTKTVYLIYPSLAVLARSLGSIHLDVKKAAKDFFQTLTRMQMTWNGCGILKKFMN